ncbi:MAG: 3-deoxy-manno-octulosonate cytidylyltransferase, partial [Acholeplasma sp.]|nr:3-deoxy-manno-octulosonate cytidylyltransferase [Acholeplasma sp.]
ALIPVRLASTRLPNKPLIKINGISMLQIVYNHVKKSNVDDVFVACCDDEIIDEVIKFGGKYIKTSSNHKNGTSRIIEAIEQIDADYILNVQGDEPLLTKKSINKLIEYINPSDSVYSLYNLLNDDIDNPNTVKLVTNMNDYAIYFSRSRIPYSREKFNSYKKHIGIYLYTKEFLESFAKMGESSLEIAESLEQLRIIENGFKIKMVYTDEFLIGVDSYEDLEDVRRIMNEKN